MSDKFDKYLPYGRQSISEEDINAVVDILRGDWLTMGPTVERFENMFAGYIGAAHAVSFSSGTAALHAAMHVAGVSSKDNAIVPSFTFAATANSVVYCGGKPIFADMSRDTLCLDPESASVAAQKAGGPVKVIAPVSYAGYPADIGEFKKIAARHGALVVEDASHALGAARGDNKVGVEADMTVFSFHPVKHITTAEGGMVTTNSSDFAKHLKLFRSHGLVRDKKDFVRPYEGAWDNDIIEIGYNYRLNEISCALGESQMKRLPSFVARRREIASLYREKLSSISGLSLPPDHPGHSYHIFAIWVANGRRNEVFEFLRQSGIGVQVHYVPVHLHTYYRQKFGCKEGDFPVTENFSAGQLSIPMFPDMTDDHVNFVAEKIKESLS
ncbi:UDP-4-amino-4,6-dideoxy-N-acetyl-beta-L-altrosamine transaminase [Synergistales bacterium]|nr:UDP-4-amino-4,6-dideoxy-N-acetyl-beta-L-altrosamine transaminase [Synergistales bacterium]